MEINIKAHGAGGLAKALMTVSKKTRKGVTDALTATGGKVRAAAQQYAPISPTQDQKNRLRKTKRKVKRKSTATSRVKPGGLRRSIMLEVDAKRMQSVLFVAVNSEAGKYARRIHDEQGKTWKKLGPGSIAANVTGKVGGKFIERAIKDNEKNYKEALKKKLDRIWSGQA